LIHPNTIKVITFRDVLLSAPFEERLDFTIIGEDDVDPSFARSATVNPIIVSGRPPKCVWVSFSLTISEVAT
jgi:hypothetical protein